MAQIENKTWSAVIVKIVFPCDHRWTPTGTVNLLCKRSQKPTGQSVQYHVDIFLTYSAICLKKKQEVPPPPPKKRTAVDLRTKNGLYRVARPDERSSFIQLCQIL